VANAVEQDFRKRHEQVPVHGLGLSVDVYSPDLSSLLGSLQRRQALPAYLEIFQATPAALKAVRRQTSDLALSYHGEGLWLIQPDGIDDPGFRQAVAGVADQLRILQSAWSNHECATKQLEGFSFGTYLPPLYTPGSAEVVAANACFVQTQLDQEVSLPKGGSPLLLLEMPPLTYFSVGTLPVATFFRHLTERAPCGLVLDMGHLWTVYRYSGAWKGRTLTDFVDEFLEVFPVERIVEIHVAGLAVHESNLATGCELVGEGNGCGLPAWTDAHMAPIPPVLFEMLDQVLCHPGLMHLRGLALEVDTKPIELIVEEFAVFQRRYDAALPRAGNLEVTGRSMRAVGESGGGYSVQAAVRDEVRRTLDRYARIVSGSMEPSGDEWTGPYACLDDLEQYCSVYLPFEILRWGGDVEAMFPETARRLVEHGIQLSRFISFWFREPRAAIVPYDFFLSKIERFLEFVHEVAPDLDGLAVCEADALRQAAASANEPAVPAVSEAR